MEVSSFHFIGHDIHLDLLVMNVNLICKYIVHVHLRTMYIVHRCTLCNIHCTCMTDIWVSHSHEVVSVMAILFPVWYRLRILDKSASNRSDSDSPARFC